MKPRETAEKTQLLGSLHAGWHGERPALIGGRGKRTPVTGLGWLGCSPLTSPVFELPVHHIEMLAVGESAGPVATFTKGCAMSLTPLRFVAPGGLVGRDTADRNWLSRSPDALPARPGTRRPLSTLAGADR